MSRSPGADIGLRHGLTGSALPTIPQSVSRGCQISWLHWFAITLRPARLLAPLYGSGRVSPTIGGFYFQASNGSVTLPVAGYDYNSNWTPLLAGLSPAGTAASFAAQIVAVPNSSRYAACPASSPTLSLANDSSEFAFIAASSAESVALYSANLSLVSRRIGVATYAAGSQADGSVDAESNCEDLILTFGAEYLKSLGGRVAHVPLC